MTDLELLLARLTTVESQFRRLRRIAIVLGILLASGGVMAQVRVIPGEVLPNGGLRMERQETQPVRAAAVEAEVRSEHFVLVDGNGKERASLVADAAGSVFLVMFDGKEKTRAQLSVSNDGPSLIFYDASGQTRTLIGSTTAVGSHVNENGVVERAPASSIILFDRIGKLLWRQP